MLTFENSLTFSNTEEPDAQCRNFWGPEDGFIWSTGKWCEITFQFGLPNKPVTGLCDLILDLDVFKVDDKYDGQNVLVYFNGARIGSLFCRRRATYVFSFDTGLLRAENILTMDTPDSATPSKFGDADGRVLGVQLFSVQVRAGA
jgi:hypothetical protein